MKHRRTVLVSLVVALLVLGLFAGDAGALAPTPRAGSLRVVTSITSKHVSQGYITVNGTIRVTNLTGHGVRAFCTITVFQQQGHHRVGADKIVVGIPAHQSRSRLWSVKGGNEGGPVTKKVSCHVGT